MHRMRKQQPFCGRRYFLQHLQCGFRAELVPLRVPSLRGRNLQRRRRLVVQQLSRRDVRRQHRNVVLHVVRSWQVRCDHRCNVLHALRARQLPGLSRTNVVQAVPSWHNRRILRLVNLHKLRARDLCGHHRRLFLPKLRYRDLVTYWVVLLL